MKYKDVLRNSLYLDEELQDYFNEMSKKGWRLDFIGYYYRFSHDEHVYKYQIDYTPSSSEYNEVLKEMGYHDVENALPDFRVLENRNVDAPDLNTEFVFNKNNKMKQFKKIRYLFIHFYFKHNCLLYLCLCNFFYFLFLTLGKHQLTFCVGLNPVKHCAKY